MLIFTELDFFLIYLLPLNVIKPSGAHTSISQKADTIITHSGSWLMHVWDNT